MPFRAYKPKEPESKIATYVRSRRQEAPESSAAGKDASKLGNQTAVKHQPSKEENAKKPKVAKKIQANRKLSGERKKSRKAKTFDISSFPRVFSTSDLMEKMNEKPDASQDCTFQQLQDQQENDQQPEASNDVENAPGTDTIDEDLDLNILCDHDKLTDINFSTANLMVFNNTTKQRRAELEEKLTQTEMDLEYKNNDIRSLSNQLQEKAQDLIIKEQKEKILAQKLEQKDTQIAKLRDENDGFKREKGRYEKSLKDLQQNIRGLEDQLQRHNFKGHVKISEYEKLRERIRDMENEREALLVESNKLKREIKEKTDAIDSLSRRNEHLQKQNDLLNVTKKENRIYALEFKVDALQDTVNKVKHENEKLKKTYTYTVNELAEYEMKQMKLREIIDKQKNSLKVLENSSSTENRHLQNYELENVRLREMNRNLFTDMEKVRCENNRLIQLVTLMPSTRKEAVALSQSKSKDGRSVSSSQSKPNSTAPNHDKINQPMALPQSTRKENQSIPIALAANKEPQQIPMPQQSYQDPRQNVPQPKEPIIMPPPRLENVPIAMPPPNRKLTPRNIELISDRKETPQSGIFPSDLDQSQMKEDCNLPQDINFDNESNISMDQAHYHETPVMDQQQIAMYLVQTPGSTPQRTSRDALQEIQNFKTTIMQHFHQNRKSKG